jgi:hypothetical protein
MARDHTQAMAGLAGGVMLAAAIIVLVAAHRAAPALIAASASQAPAQTAAASGSGIPTIDQMCASLGATGDGLAQCRADESEAADYVGAWLGYNGFIVNGAIAMDQIQLMATLDYDDPLSVAHGTADPLSAGDPDVDPTTGQAADGAFQSPAQLALFCLGDSHDWLKLHDCLAQAGAPGGPGELAPGDASAAGLNVGNSVGTEPVGDGAN